MEPITARAVLERTVKLIVAHPLLALAAFVALMVPAGSPVSAQTEDEMAISLLTSFVALIAQYWLTAVLLRREGLLQGPPALGATGSYVLFCIASSIAIVLGTLLLILPGLYLSARWILGVPCIVAEGGTASTAFAASSERTRGAVGPIMWALALINLPFAAVTVVELAWFGARELPWPAMLAMSAAETISWVGCWYAAVAVFALTRHDDGRLEAIFA